MLRKSIIIGAFSSDLTSIEIKGAESVPLGDDDQRIRFVAAGIGIIEEGEIIQ